MKTWELIKDFQEKMPAIVSEMKLSEHNYGKDQELAVNPYHAEDVWSHTCMVLLMAEQIQANDLVHYAALLHDLGKPDSLEVKEEKKRHSFIGHEGLSAYMALEYMRTTSLSNEDKVHIVKLISLHIALFRMMEGKDWEQEVAERFQGQDRLLEDLIALSYCDHQGRFAEAKEVYSFQSFRAKFDMVFEYMKEPKLKRHYQTPKTKSVTVLVGPPNAGKSTWLKSQDLSDKIILSRDQVILELAETDDYTEAFAKMDSGVVNNEFNRRIREAVAQGLSVVFDMTGMSPKSRRGLLGGFGAEYERRCVVFLTAPDVLQERNTRRHRAEKKFIPPHVIVGMMKNFTVPMYDEGFATIDFEIQEK